MYDNKSKTIVLISHMKLTEPEPIRYVEPVKKSMNYVNHDPITKNCYDYCKECCDITKYTIIMICILTITFFIVNILHIRWLKLDEITVRKAIEYCNDPSLEICQDFSKINVSLSEKNYLTLENQTTNDIMKETLLFLLIITLALLPMALLNVDCNIWCKCSCICVINSLLIFSMVIIYFGIFILISYFVWGYVFINDTRDIIDKIVYYPNDTRSMYDFSLDPVNHIKYRFYDRNITLNHPNGLKQYKPTFDWNETRNCEEISGSSSKTYHYSRKLSSELILSTYKYMIYCNNFGFHVFNGSVNDIEYISISDDFRNIYNESTRAALRNIFLYTMDSDGRIKIQQNMLLTVLSIVFVLSLVILLLISQLTKWSHNGLHSESDLESTPISNSKPEPTPIPKPKPESTSDSDTSSSWGINVPKYIDNKPPTQYWGI